MIMILVPGLSDGAWANRGCHQRSARWIAERGIHQFVDVGAGLPTVGNMHEVVPQVIPDVRVAFIDNDPMVAAYTNSLITLTWNTADSDGSLALVRSRPVSLTPTSAGGLARWTGCQARVRGGTAPLGRDREVVLESKPTVEDLGVDIDAQAWQRSGNGDDAIEIAFVHDPVGAVGDWVLMRVVGDPVGRVLAYDRHEWECFLDGVKKGEFDEKSG